MINLAAAEFLFALILLITAYLISHTINGCIQAFITWKLGDSTAKDEGFMSLNPLVHVDLFGMLALIFLSFGWFQTVPIDPYSFKGAWRYLKLLAAYCTEAFVSIGIAVASLFLCVIFFGYYLTTLLVVKLFTYYSKSYMIFFSTAAHLNIAALFTEHQSTIGIVCAFLLVSIVYLNILIATISLIFNGFRYALIVGFERGYSFIEHAEYLMFFGPFLVIYVFGDRLVYTFLRLTEWGACQIAHLFGA